MKRKVSNKHLKKFLDRTNKLNIKEVIRNYEISETQVNEFHEVFSKPRLHGYLFIHQKFSEEFLISKIEYYNPSILSFSSNYSRDLVKRLELLKEVL
jgi:hypothetical protein